MSNKLILVFNCGSSSLKFCIIDPIKNKKYLVGIAECLHIKDSKIKWKFKNTNFEQQLKDYSNYQNAIGFILKIIKKNNLFNKIYSIGHRIVHGGRYLSSSSLINKEIIKLIENAIQFAPLHNPAHLMCIKESMIKFPHLIKKNVAVFDTTFYKNMPETSYLYALPYFLYKKYGIRKYGAHGISHLYAMQQTSLFLNKPIHKLNIITCHLGNGSSVSAIREGICIDTSMGLTPLEGLAMGTRSGDLDPSIIFFLYNNLSLTIDKIQNLLNKESGLLGLTEETSDFRYIEKFYNSKKKCKRALDIYCHRLAKYISAYSSLMSGKLDALVFTGGIGENSIILRFKTIEKLSLLGFQINQEQNINITLGKSGFINKEKFKPIIIIPSNEEIIIAKDTIYLTTENNK